MADDGDDSQTHYPLLIPPVFDVTKDLSYDELHPIAKGRFSPGSRKTDAVAFVWCRFSSDPAKVAGELQKPFPHQQASLNSAQTLQITANKISEAPQISYLRYLRCTRNLYYFYVKSRSQSILTYQLKTLLALISDLSNLNPVKTKEIRSKARKI
jgi:hypothetical protein